MSGQGEKKKEVIVRTDWREGSLVIHSTNLGPLGTSWRSRVLQKLSQERTGAQPALERRCSLQGKPGAGDRSSCHSSHLFCPLEKEQECEWRKRAAELKGNTGKGKDKEEEVGFKAEWGPAISEEEKKEVEKERQNEKVKAGGSSRTTRQKGNRTRKSHNHVDWKRQAILHMQKSV